MRDRTADLLRARQALSQLSYSPFKMVGLGRFELPTSPLSGVRSNQLSYRPAVSSQQKGIWPTASYRAQSASQHRDTVASTEQMKTNV